MPFQRLLLHSRLSVPEPHALVGTATDDELPVWAENRPVDLIGVAFEYPGILACPGVPQLQGLVEARGDEAFPIRAERHPGDAGLVGLDGANWFARPGVPDFHHAWLGPVRGVPASRDDP